MNVAEVNSVFPTTRDGRIWHPVFLVGIDADKCLGCGRCFKVCGQSVMILMGITEDGDLVDPEDDDEIERKIMTVADPGSCIGCGACARVCAKNCQAYAAS